MVGRPLRVAIAELQRDRRFMGTCPVCNEDFRLADATLFALDESPPQEALAAIAAMRERIVQQKSDLKKARERIADSYRGNSSMRPRGCQHPPPTRGVSVALFGHMN
jgi:hypothetical protein